MAGQPIGYRESGGKLHELRESEIARQRRDIGMVFQRFNLFPHRTAEGNVIEGPVTVRGEKREAAGSGPAPCSTASGSATSATSTPGSSPVGSSSGWR